MATTTKKEQCAAGESSIGGGPPPDSSLSGLPQQGCEQAADQGIRLNGLQAGLVTLDVNKYRRAIRPTNIFDVLPQPIFEQMIRGFFYRIRKGVTLLWSEYDSDQRRWIFSENNRLDPFDYTNPEDRQFYNEVCFAPRISPGRGERVKV